MGVAINLGCYWQLGFPSPDIYPGQIIVFDELELILYVSQGLTLSTASLVI